MLKNPPPILDQLLNYHRGPLSTYFRKNIRIFNSMFDFKSFGANIKQNTQNSDGPYIFKLTDQIHHLIGSLLPNKKNPPRFAQVQSPEAGEGLPAVSPACPFAQKSGCTLKRGNKTDQQ